MKNQKKMLINNSNKYEERNEDIVSFHEEEEEQNYLGKKELVEIEGDKSIDPDFSYDEDRSKGSTVKRNTNNELMKLLADSTNELYQRKSNNNYNASSDFSKDLSRDNEYNTLLNSKTFNAPLIKNDININGNSINQFNGQNNKFSNILQQIPTKIDNHFYYGFDNNNNNNNNILYSQSNNYNNNILNNPNYNLNNNNILYSQGNNYNNNILNNSNYNLNHDNILNVRNNNYYNNIINNENEEYMNNKNNLKNIDGIKQFNKRENKIYQINSFDYFIIGKNNNNCTQSIPSFGMIQNTEIEIKYKELEKSYNDVLGLIQYWQSFYLDIAKLVSENININNEDPFSDEFKFAVIDNVKSIVKLAKEKAFSIFEISQEQNLLILNQKNQNIINNKKYDFIPLNNFNFEILAYEKENNIIFKLSKENNFTIPKTIKLNDENLDFSNKKNKGFKRKKYYKNDDSLDSLPPIIYRKYITEGTNTDQILFNEIEKEILEKPILKEIETFKNEKLKIFKITSFKIKKEEIKKLNNQKRSKLILKIESQIENKINIISKPKKEKIQILKVQNIQTEMKYFDIERLELLNRELSLRLSEGEREKNELKKNLEEKNNIESNIITTNNSNNILNNSNLFLPEMIPPEQTYKIFIHCIKHFKYEEENYKKYIEEEDLQNLKLFVNKMEKYLIGTSYPVQRKKQESIHYYKPIESSYQKKYKESILTGIKPLTFSKSRIDSKTKNIDYRSYSTVNNNSTFNKYKAVIKALKNW